MRAPILPYCGDQFLGIKPPDPMTGIFENRAVGSEALSSASLRMPCADINDGSYFLVSHTVGTVGHTVISRYNKANTLLWTLSGSSVANSWGFMAVCIVWSSSENRYYLPWRASTSGIVGIAYLSAPFASLNLNNANIGFNGLNTAFPLNASTEFSGFIGRDGLIRTINQGFEVFYNGITGRSGSQLTQSGINVPSGMIYRSIDDTIYCSGPYRQGYTRVFMDIMRGGKFIKIPVDWVELSSLTGEYQRTLITAYSDYVLIAEFSKQFAAGITKINRASFDNWLAANCDAMGI